jgi:hypothetical protein
MLRAKIGSLEHFKERLHVVAGTSTPPDTANVSSTQTIFDIRKNRPFSRKSVGALRERQIDRRNEPDCCQKTTGKYGGLQLLAACTDRAVK